MDRETRLVRYLLDLFFILESSAREERAGHTEKYGPHKNGFLVCQYTELKIAKKNCYTVQLNTIIFIESYSGILIFLNFQGKGKLVQKIGSSKN